MFKLFKSFVKMFVILSLLVVLTGCGGEDMTDQKEDSANGEVADEYPGEKDVITIVCEEDGEFEFSVEELMELKSVTEDIVRTDDDGEIEDEYPIKGTLFKDLLALIDKDSDNLDAIRLTAGDGYSVKVPDEILENRDVILAYEIDNEPLHEDTRPIRAFIPEEEAMYWVSNLVEIELVGYDAEISDQEASTLEEINFLETLVLELDEIDYEGEDEGKAVKTSDLFSDLDTTQDVYLLASDGFDKNEEYKTFIDAYILTEGDNTPAFRSPELPRGMHVRDLVWILTGETGFFSVEQGMEKFEEMSVEDDTGVSLKDLVDKFGLSESDKYELEAIDGYSVEIDREDLSSGIVYIRDSGEVSSAFDGLPRSKAVKDLLSIRPVK